jgi:hypothetical protein
MFGVVHMDGSGEDNPPLESLSDLYDELFTSGIEGDVSVIHDDSGWAMSAFRDGRLIFGNLADPTSERHMLPVSKERVLELWKQLINGDIEGILVEPWKPGYGS